MASPFIKQAISALVEFQGDENDGHDAADNLVVVKALALLRGIDAKQEKESEAAMGTTPAHKAMARQYSQGAPAGA